MEGTFARTSTWADGYAFKRMPWSAAAADRVVNGLAIGMYIATAAAADGGDAERATRGGIDGYGNRFTRTSR